MALAFLERNDRYSTYVKDDGDLIYVLHGVPQRFLQVFDFDVLQAAWSTYRSTHGRYTNVSPFLDLFRATLVEPDTLDEEASYCEDCQDIEPRDQSTAVEGGDRTVCESCANNYYWCEDCEESYSTTMTVGHREVCEGCLNDNYSFCEECDRYYSDSDGDGCGGDHDESSGCCEAPRQSFHVRNDGDPILANDTRVRVSLPAGTVDAQGLAKIQSLVGQRVSWDAAYMVETIGAEWQTRQGTFTKRLSRAVHNGYKIAIPAEVLSEIGNIGREHSNSVDFDLETTRDLNQSASDFYHEESCWWQSYAYSRCTLKTNGGFGLRTFGGYGSVNGRAWVMPLKSTGTTTIPAVPYTPAVPAHTVPKLYTEPCGVQGCTRDCSRPTLVRYEQDQPEQPAVQAVPERVKHDLEPTFETLEPTAYVVFNGYGDLQGYAAARILAHMAGMTYRKITLHVSNMYVNGETGYLVASEAVCEAYTDGSLSLHPEQHSDLHEHESRPTRVETPAVETPAVETPAGHAVGDIVVVKFDGIGPNGERGHDLFYAAFQPGDRATIVEIEFSTIQVRFDRDGASKFVTADQIEAALVAA